MSFAPGLLRQSLDALSVRAGQPDRYVVALSGGLDSTVLTHALVQPGISADVPIVAVHIDHGLQAESAQWAQHCRTFSASLGLEFTSVRVDVDLKSGLGPEASARAARYAVLADLVEPGDWLLSAHHRDDQAETVLLNLMRGSGPTGLAGIRPLRRFAAGWLARPLLDVPRGALLDYATAHGLSWIDDPTNRDRQYDRNYLRHEVLPRLEQRWPGAVGGIRRSADLAGEAADLVGELAAIDAIDIRTRPECLDTRALLELSVVRQRNLLRHVVAELGLPMPGAVHLEQIVGELLPARSDAQPVVAWPGAMVRRYHDKLYLLRDGDQGEMTKDGVAFDGDRLPLGPGMGKLVLRRGAKSGLSDATLRLGLTLRYRRGGEEIKPVGQTHTRKLKKLLQDENVVPWMRDRVPLLYAEERLVAVADLWIAEHAWSEPGASIEWVNRPPIH